MLRKCSINYLLSATKKQVPEEEKLSLNRHLFCSRNFHHPFADRGLGYGKRFLKTVNAESVWAILFRRGVLISNDGVVVCLR